MKLKNLLIPVALAGVLLTSCSSTNPLTPGAPSVTNYYGSVVSNENKALVRINLYHNNITPIYVYHALQISSAFDKTTCKPLFYVDSTNNVSNTGYIPLPEADYYFAMSLPSEPNSATNIEPIMLGEYANPGVGVSTGPAINSRAFHITSGMRYTLNIYVKSTLPATLFLGYTNKQFYNSTYNNSYCIWSLTRDP